VLCTGRSGSLTFIRACRHMDNYTSGHESRARVLGDGRFSYPDNHIEADNRLSWFLGKLDLIHGNDAFYVHLVRNREDTIRSYNRRWVRKGSLIRAYCEGIQQISLHRLDGRRRLEVVEDFYDQVHQNIIHFLKDKEHQMIFRIEKAMEQFPLLWEKIGAEGDLREAMETFHHRHNRSRTGRMKDFRHELKFGLMKLGRRLL
jgi:hypothetical protein